MITSTMTRPEMPPPMTMTSYALLMAAVYLLSLAGYDHGHKSLDTQAMIYLYCAMLEHRGTARPLPRHALVVLLPALPLVRLSSRARLPLPLWKQTGQGGGGRLLLIG